VEFRAGFPIGQVEGLCTQMNFAAPPDVFSSVTNPGLPNVAEIVVDAVVGPAAAPAAAPVAARPVATSAGASAPPVKRAYPAPAELPTQEGPKGLRFDFNDGCRIALPESDHPWKVRLSDQDTGNILFETELKAGRINSAKRYYVRIRIEIWQQGESIFVHEYSAKNHEVMVQFPVGTLGDPMGWFPYAVKFQERHGCKLTCAMGEKLIAIFRDAYPQINFLTHDEVKPERYYATYSIGLFFDDKDFIHQPCDFRHVGLHRTAGYILGVDPTEMRPRLSIENDARPIEEPYVCIAVQSTTQSKYWNNPDGWRSIVAFLKEAGYRVICIDQKPTHGHGLIWNHIPNGAEDETGDKSLAERVRYLRHASFFVGLSSGLSWLAWAANTPVVMISGFTHPTNEFDTPFRVVNYHACNSCWNDPGIRFDHHNFLWCPRHKDTPRQFECTRLITPDQVEAVIRSIPGFGVHNVEPKDADASSRSRGRTKKKPP
jgi:autotransporter strand-loop-strand O-heptosyltransferase